MGDLVAELGELDEVAHRLAHAVGDVAHVGDLAAHVEMQQLQRVAQAGFASARSSSSSTWRGIRPNLALSPPVFCHLPAPIDARRMRTPSSGCTPSAARFLDDQLQLVGFSMTM
jgi:hypothetical protein